MSFYKSLRIVWFVPIALIFVVMPVKVLSQVKDPFITGGLAWSPDGSQLAVGASDGVWIHNAHDLSLVRQQTGQSFVTAMDWQPEGDLIASADADGDVLIWNATTGQMLFKWAEGDLGQGTSVRWSPDGRKIASANLDGSLRIWDAKTGQLLQTIRIDGRDAVTWNPESTQVVLHGLKVPGDFGPKFGIWNVATGQLIRTWVYDYLTDSIQWSPDGRTIAMGSQSSNEDGTGGTVVLLDPDSGAMIAELQTPFAGGIGFLVWSPESSRIAAQMTSRAPDGSYPGASDLQIWDVKPRKVIALLPDIYDRDVGSYNNAVAWSRDGKRLASISDDGKVYIWDGNTYQQLAVYSGYKSMLN